MMRLIKAIVGGVIVTLLIDVISEGIENRANGKTLFGRTKKKTCMDWKGNVILGSNDYKMEEA